MKQRITVEDLQQLSPEQQERLRVWWKPEPGDWCMINHKVGINKYKTDTCYVIENGEYDWYENACSLHVVVKYRALPLLSIGQMIQLLNDKTSEQAFGYNNSGCFWSVYLGAKGACRMIDDFVSKQLDDGELIDALWQAVKEVL